MIDELFEKVVDKYGLDVDTMFDYAYPETWTDKRKKQHVIREVERWEIEVSNMSPAKLTQTIASVKTANWRRTVAMAHSTWRDSWAIPELPTSGLVDWWWKLADEEKNVVIAHYVANLTVVRHLGRVYTTGYPDQIEELGEMCSEQIERGVPQFVQGDYAGRQVVAIAMYDRGLMSDWMDGIEDSAGGAVSPISLLLPAHVDKSVSEAHVMLGALLALETNGWTV